MLVLTRFGAYRPRKHRPLILTLGTFDGVHQGHQHVLTKVCKRAKAIGGLSGVLTFSEHPMHVLKHKEPPYLITSTTHRLRLLDQMGFDLVFLMKFGERFSRLSAEAFAKKILADKLRIHEIILGYDSRFGHNREGTAEQMAQFGCKYGFRSFSVGSRSYQGSPISSTQIRSLILRGDFAGVRRLLGRPYSILGDVVKGQGLGRQLGFPTANLNPHSEALPPRGVYLVSLDVISIELKKTKIPDSFILKDSISASGLLGLLNIGFRPTLREKSKELVPEIHILNYRGNLYGKTLEVTFKKKLRDEIRFDSLEDLKKQIREDIQSVDKMV